MILLHFGLVSATKVLLSWLFTLLPFVKATKVVNFLVYFFFINYKIQTLSSSTYDSLRRISIFHSNLSCQPYVLHLYHICENNQKIREAIPQKFIEYLGRSEVKVDCVPD